MKLLVLLILCAVNYSSQLREDKRNVVVIMADDMGFNDVSFRGSNEIPTPNIDALAFNGAILNRFYTPYLCTPSRSSFMTGKDPYKIGMQYSVIDSDEPWGLGTEEKLLPQYFKDAGYATALIGKWHLGFYQQKYTPTKRGFDKFYGYLGSHIDYFNYTMKLYDRNYSRGYDMRQNDEIANDFEPIYATELFTREAVRVIEDHDKKKPLFLLLNHLAPHGGDEKHPVQAPEEEIKKFDYIKNEKRRTLAAMVSLLDASVGRIVESLRDKRILEKTLIVFFSDNGGPTIGYFSTNASNYPLRGQKETSWEGALRTNAIVYAPFLPKGVIRNQLMHVSDWLPTLGRLAGYRLNPQVKLDGVDQWNMIRKGGATVRNEIMNIDDVRGYGSYIYNTMKYVNGTFNNGASDGWLSSKNNNGDIDPQQYALNVLNSTVSRVIRSVQKETLTVENILELRKAATVSCSNSVTKTSCDLNKEACVFDIYEDPCEENNLAIDRPLLKMDLERRYNNKKLLIVPSREQPTDPACDPINFNGNWNWWQPDS